MCSIRHCSSQNNSAIHPYSAFLREICSGERDYVSIPKKDKYWLIKSLLHRRRSAHLYTVVHINNNHQDTLQLTLIRLTPKACLRRVSQSVASHQVLTSLRYILLNLLSSSFFSFFFFFLLFGRVGGGGGQHDFPTP